MSMTTPAEHWSRIRHSNPDVDAQYDQYYDMTLKDLVGGPPLVEHSTYMPTMIIPQYSQAPILGHARCIYTYVLTVPALVSQADDVWQSDMK